MKCPHCKKTLKTVEIHVDYVMNAAVAENGECDVDLDSKTVDIYSGCEHCGELIDSPVPLMRELALIELPEDDLPLIDILRTKLTDKELVLLCEAYDDGGLDSLIASLKEA